MGIENFLNDYRNPVLAEAMKTLGYVNKFGRGINTVQDILARNGDFPVDFILDDITPFKVIAHSAVPHRLGVSGDVNDIYRRRNEIF